MAAWSFCALSLLFFLLTLNSLRPVRRNRLLFLPSFVFSWLTNELAALYLAAMIGISAAFVLAGAALSQPAGWVALGAMAVTWVLLAFVHHMGVRAGQVMEQALEEMLSEMDFGDLPEPRSPKRSLYRKIRNVEFSRVAGRSLRLDVTLPVEDRSSARPAILQIHGGGWVIGDKREQGIPLLRRLASGGWVCFNANYRLSPGATWPDHLVDCKRAVAWIREHASEYGVDPSFIAVTGGSAGGHLASMLALTAGDPELQPGFEDADCSVQAAVPFYGVYDFCNRLGVQFPEMRTRVLEPLVMKAHFDDEPELFHAASPMDRVHAQAPPFLIIHGDRDTLAPVEDARHFAALLRQVSTNPTLYVELPGAQHAFEIFSSPRTRRTLHGVQRFLFACYRSHLLRRRAASDNERTTGDGELTSGERTPASGR